MKQTQRVRTPSGASTAPPRGFTLIELLARQPKPWRRQVQTAFTLIELLVVIAIISLLVSILLPSLNEAQLLAQGAVCSSRYKSISIGFAHYMNDWSERLPAPCPRVTSSPTYLPDYYRIWDRLIGREYMETPIHVPAIKSDWHTVFVCPGDAYDRPDSGTPAWSYVPRSYSMVAMKHPGWVWAYNEFPSDSQRYSKPDQQFLMSEWRSRYNCRGSNWPGVSLSRAQWVAGWETESPYANPNSAGRYPAPSAGNYHGNNSMNYLFVDGHVERLHKNDASPQVHWLPG